jgi:hypothetical protein
MAISDRGVRPRRKSLRAIQRYVKGEPTLSADFKFTGPHTLVASTWKQSGSLDDKVPVTVDLEDAFGKLPPSSD